MTNWPQKFVYVCSAGQAAIVNAVPLVHAGLDRVAEVVVFCGASRSDPDTTQRNQAVEPTRQFIETLQHWCPGLQVTPIFGDPDNIAFWQGKTAAIAEKATADIPIVLNLTGGRKQMALGALAGSLSAATASRYLIFVGGTPLRTNFVDLESMEQYPAPANQELTLPQYLGLYGVRQVKAQATAAQQRAHEIHAEPIEEFASIVMADAAAIQAIIQKAVEPCLPDHGRSFVPGPVNPWVHGTGAYRHRFQAAIALRILGGYFGFTSMLDSNGREVVHAGSIEGAKLLAGGWIEALLYNRLQQRFNNREDITILPNVSVAFVDTGSHDSGEDLGEFDIAVMIRSQLHIIETKVAHFQSHEKGAAAKALAQIDKWKRMLLGQFGRFILVQPRQTLGQLQHKRSSFLERATHSGADLMMGPQALDETIGLVERLGRR
nr:hypothetical protein [uncultured Rhodopila sp.]